MLTFCFLAVLSDDYCVVKFVRTYSMYNGTLPCGGQITPCTNPKVCADMESWGKFLEIIDGFSMILRIEAGHSINKKNTVKMLVMKPCGQ